MIISISAFLKTNKKINKPYDSATDKIFIIQWVKWINRCSIQATQFWNYNCTKMVNGKRRSSGYQNLEGIIRDPEHVKSSSLQRDLIYILPFQEHHHFTVHSMWEKINSHGFHGTERLWNGHRLRSMPCQTSITHISPSPVIFIAFLNFLRRWCAKLDSICHQTFRIAGNVSAPNGFNWITVKISN